MLIFYWMSRIKLRPDFTAMHNRVLVLKGEAKATYHDLREHADDLIKKFHPDAYKLFPRGASCIPGVATCNEVIILYRIERFARNYSMTQVNEYRVMRLPDRVAFIVDIFKLLVWIASQTEPVEGCHLWLGIRRKTRNQHHVTWNAGGILKEFNKNKLSQIPWTIIRHIYLCKLPNVEHGTVNCTSVTITRVGSMVKDALVVRGLSKEYVYEEIALAVGQLHTLGYAHCDICLDNCFVDSVDNGGHVFLGDLEYCCLVNASPPVTIRRANAKCRTAGSLDDWQLLRLKDELASL